MRKEYEAATDTNAVIAQFDADWGQLRAGQAWAARPDTGDRDLAFLFAQDGNPLVSLRHPPSVMRAWIDGAASHETVQKDPAMLAENLNVTGFLHFKAAEFEQAREVWRRAIELLERADVDPSSRYFALQRAGYESNIAMAEERLGRHAAAREALEHARQIFAEFGERQQEGRMYMNLGTLYAEEDEHDRAIEAYERATVIARETNDREGLELALGAMGNSMRALGRLIEARSTLEQALALTRALGNKAVEALRLGNLAHVALDEGDRDRAMTERLEALKLAREIGDPRTQALQVHGIGEVHAARGAHAEAWLSFSEAEQMFEQIGMAEAASRDRRAAGHHSWRAAIDAYQELIATGRGDEALAELDRWCARGYEATPHMQRVLVGLYAFGEHVAGRLARAADLFAEALRLDRAEPADELQANHLGNVGDLYRHLGDGYHARLAYRAALSINSVSNDMRAKLAGALQLAEELEAAVRPPLLDPGIVDAAGLELANRTLGGAPVFITATYAEGFSLTGRSLFVKLGPERPEISLQLPGGLPVRLAFDRISSIEVRA